MKPHYSLDDAVKFFSRIGSSQALIILYLADKFDGVFIRDFSYPLDVAPQRVERICRDLEAMGIIDKTPFTRAGGRAMKVKVNPDARKVLSRFLSDIAGSEEVTTAEVRYQSMIDNKQTMAHKYNL
jgi:DNA-binding MarR family transcriptional regulator